MSTEIKKTIMESQLTVQNWEDLTDNLSEHIESMKPMLLNVFATYLQQASEHNQLLADSAIMQGFTSLIVRAENWRYEFYGIYNSLEKLITPDKE